MAGAPAGIAQQIVLVDNASTDGVADDVEQRWPDVSVVRSAKNLGFGGGCNLGLRDVADVDYVALVNNDAVVDAGWLLPLVAGLEDDPSVGAACPRIVFDEEYAVVRLEPETADARVLLHGARFPGGVAATVRYGPGFGAVEPQGTAWVRRIVAPAALYVADRGDRGEPSRTADTVELLLSAARPTQVSARSGSDLVRVTVGRQASWAAVPLAAARVTVINNAGNIVLPDGYGVDRGFGEVDAGQYSDPSDVAAWCGGAVLLRTGYLRSVGTFDERLFLYYEDLELAWRGRRHGWRYRYVPGSVVRHSHAASTGPWSPAAEYYKERNRLVVLVRHAPWRVVMTQVLLFLPITASYFLRDCVVPIVRRRRLNAAVPLIRLRALGGWLRLAPAMVIERRHDRRAGRRLAAVWHDITGTPGK